MAARNLLWRRLRKSLLLVLTIGSVFLGVLAGGLLRYAEPSSNIIKLIGFPGLLFMNMLKAMILPLIAASLISGQPLALEEILGLAQLDGKTSGKVGSRALLYYFLTTSMAVIVSPLSLRNDAFCSWESFSSCSL